MNVLTAEEMAATDRRSVEAGVPVRTLMEHAGSAVVEFCLRRYADAGIQGGAIVVLCGKGNNGGDGLVAARLLAAKARRVHVVLLGSAGEMRGDAVAAFASAKEQSGVEVFEIDEDAALQERLQDAGLVIDAVVGTGFKPPLRGLAATAKTLLDAMKMPVVAVDLPSGWDADSMEQRCATAFRADAVVTFVAPKMAHVFGHLTPGRAFGPVVVAAIGTPENAVVSKTGLHWAGGSKAIAEKPRDINGNKGKFGHVMVIGGAVGKAGAPSMASLACMRAGAGLTTCAVVKEILPTVAAIAPELMMQGLGTGEGGLSLKLLEADALEKMLKGISVVAMGPGLGTEGTTPEFVREFVRRVEVPMVLDADALNALAGHTEILQKAAKSQGTKRTIVLTPHPGEMARLMGMTVKEVEADRIGLARRFAMEQGVTLVLKGWRTLIAHPDGRIAVNTTGNPSMAKGGSGDILTGIVAALLAQYADRVAEAVEAAVLLHGLAGDFACVAQDEHTVLATDTVAHLWQSFKTRVVDADGLTWIAGLAAAQRLERALSK